MASSARLTESVSFRSLACSLCSNNCRFFAYIYVSIFTGGGKGETDSFACIPLLVLKLGLVQRAEYNTKHAFTTFAFTGRDGEVNLGSFLVSGGHGCRGGWGFVGLGLLRFDLSVLG